MKAFGVAGGAMTRRDMYGRSTIAVAAVLALGLLLQACAATTPPPAPTYDYERFSRAMAAYRVADYPTAFDEFRPLAEAGMPAAQFRLGLMYENGRGVAKDLDAAEAWYGRAGAQGYGEALYNMGHLRYLRGDVADAVDWWTRGARRGSGDAMYRLGLVYDEGKGVPRDLMLAHMWYDLAAAAGVAGAAERRDALEPLMGAAELAEARAKARVWGSETTEGL